jgi:hypothetical protein
LLLDAKIAPLAARHAREAALLKTLPGFGDVIVAGRLQDAPAGETASNFCGLVAAAWRRRGGGAPAARQNVAASSRLRVWQLAFG